MAQHDMILVWLYSQVFEALHGRPCCRDRALDSNSFLIGQQLTIPLQLPDRWEGQNCKECESKD
jgi:hypothetical protein